MPNKGKLADRPHTAVAKSLRHHLASMEYSNGTGRGWCYATCACGEQVHESSFDEALTEMQDGHISEEWTNDQQHLYNVLYEGAHKLWHAVCTCGWWYSDFVEEANAEREAEKHTRNPD
jgi:hypothetical protein